MTKKMSLLSIYSESNLAKRAATVHYADEELMEASHFLQTLVHEAGASIGSSLPAIDHSKGFRFRDQQSKERIYKLVYGTMKCTIPFGQSARRDLKT
jgi:hypothetical protein